MSKPMVTVVEVSDEQINDNHELWLGQCWIDERDLDRAREALALSIAIEHGDPEPVLYDDTSPHTTNMVDEDTLAQVVEIQARMDVGRAMIDEAEDTLGSVVHAYVHAKACFQVAKDTRTEWVASGAGTWPQYTHTMGFNLLKAARDKAYSLLQERRETLQVQYYWDCWNILKDTCNSIVKGNKALWAVFFTIEDKEEWLGAYNAGESEYNDKLESKRAAPQIDNRMLLTDEAYFQAHMEEQAELFVYL